MISNQETAKNINATSDGSDAGFRFLLDPSLNLSPERLLFIHNSCETESLGNFKEHVQSAIIGYGTGWRL